MRTLAAAFLTAGLTISACGGSEPFPETVPEPVRRRVNIGDYCEPGRSDFDEDGNMLFRPVHGSRMNCRGADLRNADMSGFNLSDADLTGADLRGADMLTNLRFANVSGADLGDTTFLNLRDSINRWEAITDYALARTLSVHTAREPQSIS